MPTTPTRRGAEPQSAAGRRVVLVAGTGRSGTSTLTGILRILGLRVPQPEVVADATNPKGFGEPRWVVDLHRNLLRRSMVHVSDARPHAWQQTERAAARDAVRRRAAEWLSAQLAQADELVVKDPRMGWFLQLWRETAVRCDAEPCFATMLRAPAEVVASQHRYYGDRLGAVNETAAWLNMMLHTESATREAPRVLVRYADLLTDPTGPVRHAGDALGLRCVTSADEAALERVRDFVDPSLRRVQQSWQELGVPGPLRDLADEAYEQLGALSEPGGDTAERRQALDGLRASYVALYEESEALTRSSTRAAALEGAARARRSGAEPDQPTERSEVDPTGSGSDAPQSVTGRIAARLPAGVRAGIPRGVRRQVRRAVQRRHES